MLVSDCKFGLIILNTFQNFLGHIWLLISIMRNKNLKHMQRWFCKSPYQYRIRGRWDCHKVSLTVRIHIKVVLILFGYFTALLLKNSNRSAFDENQSYLDLVIFNWYRMNWRLEMSLSTYKLKHIFKKHFFNKCDLFHFLFSVV